jgi:hypothetical protein
MTDIEARKQEIVSRCRVFKANGVAGPFMDVSLYLDDVEFLIEQLRAAQQAIEMEDLACSESHKVDRERIKELKAENAELRRDKERLEYVLSHEYQFCIIGEEYELEIKDVDTYYGKSERECIDAALDAAKEKQ